MIIYVDLFKLLCEPYNLLFKITLNQISQRM